MYTVEKGIDATGGIHPPFGAPSSALHSLLYGVRMLAVRAFTSQKATNIVVFGSLGSRQAGWKRLTLLNVKLVRRIMTTAHSFDIEPIARFAGLNAGIRRPKVGPDELRVLRTIVAKPLRRKSHVFLMMTSTSSVWMLRRFATITLRACRQI